MKIGENALINGCKGKVVKIHYFVDGTQVIRLRDKNNKLWDHFIMPDKVRGING